MNFRNQIGNSYESVPAILTAFLEQYPQNSNRTDIEKILGGNFLRVYRMNNPN
jgi:hypothetical protein